MTPADPSATPAPEPNEPGSTPSPLNEAQLASLTKTEEICRAALKAALQTYKDAQTNQSGAIGQASGTRIDRNALVEQATERRLWLQFAADAEWTPTDPANTPIRRQFHLPANRAFIG